MRKMADRRDEVDRGIHFGRGKRDGGEAGYAYNAGGRKNCLGRCCVLMYMFMYGGLSEGMMMMMI